MRLSAVLSKKPQGEFVQVDGFLTNKKGKVGQQVKISVGEVMLNYYCGVCEDTRTFSSVGHLTCIFVNYNVISIDCVLSCRCGANVQVWFLVESDVDIREMAPNVRILKKSEKLSDMVKITSRKYGELSNLLDRAQRAYREGLGAGSIVYLRKIFEKTTIQVAETLEIQYKKYEDGNPKNFRALLESVDKTYSIIPREFSKNGYKLFRELSRVIHGEYDEESALQNYKSLQRLVIGILDNIKNKEELENAITSLGWEKERGEYAE